MPWKEMIEQAALVGGTLAGVTVLVILSLSLTLKLFLLGTHAPARIKEGPRGRDLPAGRKVKGLS